MCEAFLNRYAGDRFEAHSAGLEPSRLNPLVIEAMAEIDFDISRNRTKSVFDIWRSDQTSRYVIAVCDREAAEKCPIFPGIATRLQWPFQDPARVTGGREENLRMVRRIRDEIGSTNQDWPASLRQEMRA
jgi:arsenate reductase (thioredoxin)